MLAQELVLPRLIERRTQEAPDRVFLEEVDGRSMTYAGLHQEALRWASAYRALGVEENDRVAVLMPTSIDAVCAWLGLAWLRAIEVPVNTAYRGRMLEYVITNSKVEVLVVASQYLDRLTEIAPSLPALRAVVVPDVAAVADDLPFHAVGRDAFLDGLEPAEGLVGPEHHDIAMILYTSGTTGPSKGVLMPWGQLYATASANIFVGDFGEDDAFYLPFPIFHVSGKGPIYTFALVGGRVVMRESFVTREFWGDIARYRCTATALLGAMANFVYRQEPRADDADTPLHTAVMVPLIPEFEHFKQRFGVRLSTAFNMTETSVPIHSDSWTLPNARSCGTLRPGYQVRIVDAHDEEVAPGEIGELVIRADEPWTMMAGYWEMPEETLKAWRNQWLHTGDAFTRDEQGNFFFVDRFKDTIRRRGENISSAEVESFINEHPAVLESAAIAVPSPVGEDDVKAVVVLRPKLALRPEELIEFLAPRMPRFMVPRYLEFVKALPKTPTEKVRKTELRALGITPTTWDRDAAGIALPRS